MPKRILLLLVLFSMVLSAVAQNSDVLEAQLEASHGLDKLIILNELTELYLGVNSRKALKYGKQGVALADKLLPVEDSINDQYFLKVDAYNLLGEARFGKERYYDARVSFKYALTDANRINYIEGADKATSYISRLDTLATKSNLFRETFGELRLGQTIKDGSKDITLNSTLKAAESNEEDGKYFKAIANYEKAINFLKDQGEEEQIAEIYKRIAENYEKAGNIPKSLEYYNMAIGEKEKTGDTIGLQASRDSIESLHVQLTELVGIVPDTVEVARKKEELKSREDFRQMAEESEANEDYEKSLEYLKLYTELNEKIIEDEKKQELALLEKSYQIETNLQEIQLLTQEYEIQDLELQQKKSEIEQQNKFRENLTVGIALLLALAAALYLLYFNKRRDHIKLNSAHTDLQLTQDQLVKAEKRIKTLLDQQVSTAVAQELISENDDKKVQRKMVCVMFLDIRGFTTFAESRRPEDIIKYQNDVFGFMIDSVYKHHGIINQFLGDGFMATFGAPVSSGNDSENAFLAAMEIIRNVNLKSENREIPETRIGIGLHTGRVVVGNVGTSLRKQYSITGNAVIIAARIEQLNKKYKSQLLVSEEVLQKIEKVDGKPEPLGSVELKGREKPVKLFIIV